MEYFRIYETTDSTNKEALRLLARGLNLHGNAILGRHQTEGRGQYGRSWFAAPGSHLAMSIILQPPQMVLTDLPLLAMKASLAVVRTLRFFVSDIHPLIKWPNDIYVDEHKIAGILVENSISSMTVQHSVIGIGMNVNEIQFPANLPNPISLKILTGKEFEIEALAEKLRENMMKILDEPLQYWKPEYDELIYGRGHENDFELTGKKISAEVIGVDDAGRLCIDAPGISGKSYFSHEIKWWK